MPVEIKELIIRASVQGGVQESGKNTPSQPESAHKNGMNEEKIVHRCVEQVMEILRIQNER